MQTSAEPPAHYSADQYFSLADAGLSPDERVELIAGMIVAMAPQSPRHATCLYRITQCLPDALPAATVVRTQMPFVASANSVPEPDVAFVPGVVADYAEVIPQPPFSSWRCRNDGRTGSVDEVARLRRRRCARVLDHQPARWRRRVVPRSRS